MDDDCSIENKDIYGLHKKVTSHWFEVKMLILK